MEKFNEMINGELLTFGRFLRYLVRTLQDDAPYPGTAEGEDGR